MWSKTPRFAQRRNRMKILFHFPKPVGKSRHGEPVLTRHNTASRKNRVSFAVTPQSVGLPGNMQQF